MNLITLEDFKHMLGKIFQRMEGGQIQSCKIIGKCHNCWWKSVLPLVCNNFSQKKYKLTEIHTCVHISFPRCLKLCFVVHFHKIVWVGCDLDSELGEFYRYVWACINQDCCVGKQNFWEWYSLWNFLNKNLSLCNCGSCLSSICITTVSMSHACSGPGFGDLEGADGFSGSSVAPWQQVTQRIQWQWDNECELQQHLEQRK